MLKHIKNNKGSSLVGTMIMITLIAYMGAAIMDLTSSDSSTSTNEVQSVQALQVGNGGIQYALDRVNRGLDPRVTDKEFGPGAFTITTSPDSQTIYVVSTVGEAQKTQTLNANFSSNCVDLDVTPAYANGTNLSGIELVKGDCNTAAIVSSVSLSWNWSTCATSITCTQDSSFYDSSSNNNGRNSRKTTICHIPPGNPSNQHTISVGSPALEAHLAHGDVQGACSNEDTAAPICEGSESIVTSCSQGTNGAHVTQVTLDDTVIYTGSVDSGATIDVDDYTLDEVKNYIFNAFQFSTAADERGWYSITVNFADGSSLTKSFKIGDEITLTDDDGTVSETTISEHNGYEVDNGTVTVASHKEVSLQVLGSAITCGAGGPEVNVSVDLAVNGNYSSLFNGSDVDGGETYETATDATEVDYKVKAHAELDACNHFSVTYDSTNTGQVRTLLDGDQAPALQGFGGQQPISSFLADYLDSSGNISLEPNQVIMLFELGSNAVTNSTGSDFQDLVVLMTITEGQ